MITQNLLDTVYAGDSLSREQSEQLFDKLFAGELDQVQTAGLLVAMKMRKESAQEIAGAAIAMRRAALPVDVAVEGLFDTCGTGGDGSHSFNYSSAVSIVIASMGVPVAKHGNRSVSSKSGSADFLEALNIPLSLTGAEAKSYFDRHNFLFMFAQVYHPAMKHAAPVRKALATRTIFNLLGPLTNPAKTKRQMIGVCSRDFLPLYAEAAKQIGFDRIALYSSHDGMDEVSPLSPTEVYEINENRLHTYTIDQAKYISADEAAQIPSGKDAAENARLFTEALSSANTGPLAKAIALNCALALLTSGHVATFDDGYHTALEQISSGKALAYLNTLAAK